jgi:hypothetical protein
LSLVPSYFRVPSVLHINTEWKKLKFGVGGSSSDIKSINSFVKIGKMGKKITRRHTTDTRTHSHKVDMVVSLS